MNIKKRKIHFIPRSSSKILRFMSFRLDILTSSDCIFVATPMPPSNTLSNLSFNIFSTVTFALLLAELRLS